MSDKYSVIISIISIIAGLFFLYRVNKIVDAIMEFYDTMYLKVKKLYTVIRGKNDK